MKKKALIVANLAGFASFLISDIEILQSMGYEVVYAANTKILPWEDTRKKLLALKVKIENIDFDTKNPLSKLNIKAYKQLKKMLKTEQFDLIHCHTPIVGFLTRLVARKNRKIGTKIIYTTHGFAFNENSSKKSWLFYYNFEKFGSKFSDAMITINREDYNNAKKMYCKKVYQINGVGIDLKRFKNININRDLYRKKIGINIDDFMILSVGELSDRKNHQIIIKAIGNIKNHDKIVYVVCGQEASNSNKGKELMELAKNLNVKLILLGHREDIPQLYRCADISAIPSVREGLGMAGIESLASRVPLVGTHVQGIKEYLIDNKTGYSSDAYDYVKYSENIEKLMNMDKEERELMENNCSEVVRKFDVENSKIKMFEIYKDIIKEK